MKAIWLLILFTSSTAKVFAQATKRTESDSIMINVFLQHQQDKSLTELQKKQEENKLWEMFPPKQSRVVS